MDTAHNKAIVAQFDELGNRGGDLAILDTLCTQDMVNHALAADGPHGWRELESFSAGLIVTRTAAVGSAPSLSPKATWSCSSARVSSPGLGDHS